jgi:hypothetical protein
VEIGSIGQWFAASATTAAVLVALFKDEFLKWRRRPILSVSVALEPPHCHSTILHYQAQRTALTFVAAQCYYFRIWISNEGKSRAEKVQVFAATLSRRVADGSFHTEKDFLPMNLRWSHGKGPNESPEIYAEGISPKMGKHCDLGHIVDPTCQAELSENLESVPVGNTILALDLEVAPNTRSHLLSPGTYLLELQIAGANCAPVVKKLELTITGKWFQDERKMFQDGIGLRVSEKDL